MAILGPRLDQAMGAGFDALWADVHPLSPRSVSASGFRQGCAITGLSDPCRNTTFRQEQLGR